MTIYDAYGAEIYDAPVTKAAIIKCTLMGDYYIELPFNTGEYISFPMGCYVLYKGRKFEILSIQYPEPHNGGYKYTLRFDAQQNKMKHCKVFWPKSANHETTFQDTAKLADFGNLIVANMNRYLGGDNWKFGGISSYEDDLTKAVSFNGDFCWDALNNIASTFDVEWWTTEDGNEVRLYFGKLALGTSEVFKKGDVVTNIPTRKGNDDNYGTRFYVFGSTKNLPADYDTTAQGGVTNHISQKRLHLPDGMQYIDAWEGLMPHDVVEQVAFFEDVYPKNTETVTAVFQEYKEIVEGERNAVFTMYCADTPFTPDDLIEGEILGCKFTSGSLNGMEFELIINESNFNKRFEIKAITEGAGGEILVLPNESLYPTAGDTFILTGVQLPKERVDEAEQELLKVGKVWAAKNSKDTNVYDCPTNPVYCRKNDKNYDLGQKVLMIATQFGASGRESRIQGFEKKLYDEYQATYTVGDNTAYSRLGNIEKSIEEAAYAERIGSTTGGVGIYVIRSKYDSTQPSDTNVYSALATLTEFLSKNKGGAVNAKVSFLKDVLLGQGFTTQDFFSGGAMVGAGAGLYSDGQSSIFEVDKLVVRKEASFAELVINQTTFQLGETVFSQGGCTITDVVEEPYLYRCYYNNKDGKRFSGLEKGDLVRCQRYDANFNSIIKYYWRRVEEVTYSYVSLSKYSSDGDGIPDVGDDIVHFGNVDNPARQSALVISPLNGGSMTVLSGINTFSLTDTEYVGLGVKYDQDTSSYKAYIYGYGDMYFGSRPGTENAQYIEFVNGVMNIKANVSIGPDTDLSGNTSLQEALKTAGGNKVFSFGTLYEVPLNYKSGDLWIINTQNYLNSKGANDRCPDGAKDGEIWVAINNYNHDKWFQVGDWVSRVTYTDDTAADKAQAAADLAQTKADTATAKAEAATNTANAAKNRLDGWASDKVISKFELEGVKAEYKSVCSDKEDIVNSSEKYTINNDDFVSAFDNYEEVLLAIISSFDGNANTETVEIPAGFATYQDAYYTQRTAILKSIADAAQKLAQDAKNTAYGLQTAVNDAQKDAEEALAISQLYNDDGYLTPSEKRTLRQMMYELSDSEGVAEPYWAKVQHSTAAYNLAWHIVKEGDVSNNHSQDEWVGWWTFRNQWYDSRQNIKIDAGSKNTRNINIQFALDTEGEFNAITLSGNGNGLPITISGNDTDKLLSYEVSETSEYNIFCELNGPSFNNTFAGYYKVVGDGLEYWAGNTQYLCYKGSYPTLYAALYNAGKVDEANELKTRFTAIIDCLQLAEVYGDEDSKKNTSLKDVYPEFRSALQKALNDYFNYVEICNLNDVDYLKKVFPNAVLNSNGAVLSQLLAVKDGTDADANIVAGIYGGGSYELNKETGLYDHDVEDGEGNVIQNGHGTLMFFAGAEGLDSVSEAKTRIYEDGHAVFNDVETTGGFKSSSGGKRIEVISTKDGRDAGMYVFADNEVAALSENDSPEVLVTSFTSERKSIADLYTETSVQVPMTNTTLSYHQSAPQVSSSQEKNILSSQVQVTTPGGVLKLPTISGILKIENEGGINPNANAYVNVYVNGQLIHTEGIYNKSGTSATKLFTIAARQMPSPTGEIVIKAVFMYAVSDQQLGIGHDFSVELRPQANGLVDYSQYVASYFANGLALGSSSSNLFTAINEGGNMIVRAIANNYGINITKDGLQLRIGGVWYDALCSSNNSLQLMPAANINN